MKRVIKWRLKSVILSLICLGFLAGIFMPATGLALSITSDGTAQLTNVVGTSSGLLTFSYTSSFSGSWVTLNGAFTDPGASDVTEAGFLPTSFTASLSSVGGTATGHAVTFNGGLASSSHIALTPPGSSSGSVPIAQAVFFGIFTVDTDGLLTVSADYILSQSLFSDVPLTSAFADSLVSVDVSLFDDTTGAQLASDPRSFYNSIRGAGGFTLPVADQSGTLGWSYALVAGVPYDIEIYASAAGSASTPEPTTLFLLGGGLIGLATTLRKRFKKSLN